MEDITAMAERLGRAIASSPQARALREARKAVAAEPETTKLLKDFQAQSEKIAKLEAEQKPVEVEEKHKLDELHSGLVASGSFKTYTAAQVEYVDVIRKVNDAIRRQLGDTEESGTEG